MLSLVLSAFVMTTFEGRVLLEVKPGVPATFTSLGTPIPTGVTGAAGVVLPGGEPSVTFVSVVGDALIVASVMVGISVMSLTYSAALMLVNALKADEPFGRRVLEIAAFLSPVFVLCFLVGHATYRAGITDFLKEDRAMFFCWMWGLFAVTVALIPLFHLLRGRSRGTDGAAHAFAVRMGRPPAFAFWFVVVMMVVIELLLGWPDLDELSVYERQSFYGAIGLGFAAVMVFTVLCERTLAVSEAQPQRPPAPVDLRCRRPGSCRRDGVHRCGRTNAGRFRGPTR
ncbi:MAG TPA: hypothetical protein VN408_23880 [Actinoplanes sp.]|nr:hypothetical protein [Actinoplanes sp.]